MESSEAAAVLCKHEDAIQIAVDMYRDARIDYFDDSFQAMLGVVLSKATIDVFKIVAQHNLPDDKYKVIREWLCDLKDEGYYIRRNILEMKK